MSRVELEESEDKRDKEGAPGYRYQVSSTLSISASLKSKKIFIDNDDIVSFCFVLIFIGVKLTYNVAFALVVQNLVYLQPGVYLFVLFFSPPHN